MQVLEDKLGKERQNYDSAVQARDQLQKEVTELAGVHAKAVDSLNNTIYEEQQRSAKMCQDLQEGKGTIHDLKDRLRKPSTYHTVWSWLRSTRVKVLRIL